MTFKELVDKFYKEDNNYHNLTVYEIIYYLSKKVKNKTDLITNDSSLIDFDVKYFLNIYNKVFYKNVPIEYITNKFTFLNEEYFICKGVFIPRPETEFLVSTIIEKNILDNKNNILDLCSGSGVIANSLAIKYNDKYICGVEKKIIPFNVSKYNAKIKKLKTNFVRKDVFKLGNNFVSNFDAIVCNPPYVSNDFSISKWVKKEPRNALFAKDEGLYFYKKIINDYYHSLKKNTILIFEIGYDQKEKLEEFLNSQNITSFYFIKDLNKIDRILIINKEN
ncbi:peptide chain release factor N(5)-glutamine methyltransferase [Malacoplasma iowae]|uniref:peptide chain release factor N(5)-glutamine methyltransferase n=1 Tax=Malacoplasma iowae TaxID=2116 RepID=UPI002A18CD42|nr:peptide chain release factor N(5)-glutamine methyltransferase [Malacoplasma iowae]WPL40310.1 peptide chain release factor N(5)-glutamine methyltransferase [Malacoplasma iowae]